MYRPATALKSGTPIVFLYGGNWRKSNRCSYRFIGQMLMSRGYLVIIPDYRLYPEVTFWGLLGMPPLPSAGSVGRSLRAAVILVGSLSPVIRLVPIVPHGAIAGPYAFDPSRFSNTRPIFATAHPPAAARLIFFAHAGAPPALLIHFG